MELVPLPRSRPRWGLLLLLARRSLLGNRQTFALLVIAVAAGAGFQIPNTGNLAGFSAALLEEELTRGAGDVRVKPREKPLFEWGRESAARVLASAGSHVRTAIPVLILPGAAGLAGHYQNALIYGLDFPGHESMHPFHLTDGALLSDSETKGVLIGTSLATRIHAKVGDTIELRIILGGATPDSNRTARLTMTIRGLVAGSAGAYRSVFVNRALLAEQLGMKDAASDVLVHLDDHFAAPAATKHISDQLADVSAVDWERDDPYVANYLSANRTVNAISYGMVVAAISIPVLALFYIRVLARRREIGILAAVGFTRYEIFLVFLLQALCVAFVGLLLGSVLGLGLIKYFQTHPIFSWEALTVRPVVSFDVLVVPCLAVLITTLLAGSWPAWLAAHTDPARILRRLDE